eukprot:ctg_357.g227
MELVYSVGRRGSGWDTAGQGGRRGGRATDARSSAWSVPRGLSQSRASWCCCGYDCVAAVEDTVEWDTTAVEGDGEEPATGDAGSVLVFDVDAPGEMARLCSPASLTPESVAWEPPRRPEYGVRWQMAADGTWQGQVLEEEEDGEHRMASRGSAARLPALLVLYSMSVWRVWVPRTPGFCSNRWEVLFTEECPETLLCVHWIGLPGNAPAGVCALTSSGALVLWWPTQIAGAEWDAEGTAADERAIPSARERQQSWMSPSAFTYRRCAQVQLADDAVIRYASMHSLSARHCWRRHRLHERQQQRRVAAAVGERIATRDAADGLPAGVCTALRIAYVNASSLDRVRVHDVLVVALQVPVDEESGKDANLRDKDIALVPFEAGEVVLQPAESERSAANGNGCGGREATPSTAAARVDDIVLGAEGQALYIAHQRATALSLHWDGDEAVDDGEQMPDAATGNGHGGGHAVGVLQHWRWCGTLHSDTAFTALTAIPAPQPGALYGRAPAVAVAVAAEPLPWFIALSGYRHRRGRLATRGVRAHHPGHTLAATMSPVPPRGPATRQRRHRHRFATSGGGRRRPQPGRVRHCAAHSQRTVALQRRVDGAGAPPVAAIVLYRVAVLSCVVGAAVHVDERDPSSGAVCGIRVRRSGGGVSVVHSAGYRVAVDR